MCLNGENDFKLSLQFLIKIYHIFDFTALFWLGTPVVITSQAHSKPRGALWTKKLLRLLRRLTRHFSESFAILPRSARTRSYFAEQ